MDMLNRIKNTVSSFSTVLPGNPVTREYEIIEHIGSAGPSLLWKVFKGIKKSTKEEAAVFVLEKKLLEKYPKSERDSILEIMKKGIANLTRLRHPSILTVQHPLEESRESLAFATEPVFASLANVLGSTENMPIPPPKILKDYSLYDVEIKYGLLQVIEGLAFLHNDVKMLHGNINPESILVNKNGSWKLAGFDFSIQDINAGSIQFPFGDIDINRPPPSLPHLNYLAPECVLTSSCSTASDMFSLGALIYSVYNNGKSLLNNCGGISSMKQNLKQLKQLPQSSFNCLPAEVREHVKLLLNATPEVRPDAFQTSKLQMFEDIGVKTLQYLDSLYQWDNLQKSHFYKGLPQVISKLPKRVNLFRVLPCLTKEYCNVEMVPFILPNVLMISDDATKEEFQTYILQDMLPLFRLQEPIQVMLIFMQKMGLLLTKCPPAAINNHVLPMIYRALEADAQQIQELCLTIIPGFAGMVDYSAIKNSLLPRIKKLCLQTSFLSVRVNCLVCLGKLLDHLDKWLVLDEILPFLPQIPSKEPAVLMGILGILKITMSHKKLGITKEVMATKTIPFLMPLSIENGLTLNQFNAIMTVVKEMVSKVEAEHKTKLEQLNSIRQQQHSALGMSQISAAPPTDILQAFSQDAKASEVDNLFKNLGLSSFDAADSQTNASKFTRKNSPDHYQPSVTKSQSLSLDEKKRLAWEQEQHLILKTQQSVPLAKASNFTNPTTAAAVNTSRDLTSMLINSNLAGFHSEKQMMVPKDTMLGFQTTIGCVSPVASNQTFLSTLQSPVNNLYSKPCQNPATPLQLKNLQQKSQSVDMSSLDSLLPNLGNKSRPLNQMTSGPQISPVSNINTHWTQELSFNSSPPSLSQPQSLPVFPTQVNNPKAELKDLLG